MENIIPFTLFGSGIFFGIMILALLIIFIISEVEENGFLAFGFLIVALILNHFWGTFLILSILSIKNILIYLLIGFFFSLIRTYFKGKKIKKEDKILFDLKDHVFRWWLMFPISMLTWIFGDLLKDLYNFIYSKIGKLYEKIFNL